MTTEFGSGTSPTRCTRCGDCCERIHANPVMIFATMAAKDPAEQSDVGKSNIATARFIMEHWTVKGVVEDELGLVTQNVYACDQFNAETRECEAHDARPAICAGFPWYGGEPRPESALPARCSFNADVRTTLPIVAVNGRAT